MEEKAEELVWAIGYAFSQATSWILRGDQEKDVSTIDQFVPMIK